MSTRSFFQSLLSNTYIIPLVLYMLLMLVVMGAPLACSRCLQICDGHRIYIDELVLASWHNMKTVCVSDVFIHHIVDSNGFGTIIAFGFPGCPINL